MQLHLIEEAARTLHLHPESLRRLCRQGKINFGRSGKRIVFTDGDLQAYITANGSESIRTKISKRLAR
jgi:excisionase family DNA binding protein